MPRPPRAKRAKLAPSHPEPEAPATANPAATTAQVAHRVDSASSDIYDVSDREKDRRKSSRQAGKTAAESGDLTALRSRLNVSSEQGKALESMRRRSNRALSRLDNITSTTHGATSSSEDSPAIELGRREQTATRRGGRFPDASGLDIDDDIFGELSSDLDDNLDVSPEAHPSTDTSLLNLGQFKRRPRQSSIIGRDDGPIRPSSRGPNTPGLSSNFNIGLFKRRAREPSILGTAQKDKSRRQGPHASDSDLDADLFDPEAESTPLGRSTRRRKSRGRQSPEPGPSSSSARKRKLAEDDDEDEEPDQRGSDEDLPGLAGDVRQTVEQSDDDSNPSSPISPLGRAVQQPRPVTPIANDDIMAPPASSGSSEGSPANWPSLHTLARRRHASPRRTPTLDDNVSDISSPPSLTHSPNYQAPKPTTRGKGRAPPSRGRRRSPKPTTTADLTSLLPRRRHRGNRDDPFDIDASGDEMDASGLGNDEDELSYLDSRARSRRRARPLGRATSTNQDSGRRKRSKQPRGKQTPTSRKKAGRTYGSRASISRASDKENGGEEGEGEEDEEDNINVEPFPDDTFDATGETGETRETRETSERMGEELRAAAKKFKEVDKWELAFEEDTASSSPRDGR